MIATACHRPSQLQAQPQPQTPLQLKASNIAGSTIDLTVRDQDRNRDIPVLIYLPAQTDPAPVVLFSHGLGGNRQGSTYLGQHWASQGYVAVFLQHPGSDDAVWQEQPLRQRQAALRRAASTENFLLRVKDVPAVLDQLEVWQQTSGHPLDGRLDLSRIGMSGHSFGAITTQAVSGQFFSGQQSYTDARVRAALVMSPSVRQDATTAFDLVKIPWMLMTGTQDVSSIGNITVENRLQIFPNLPSGNKYELVLDGAEHSAFTERSLRGDNQRNPNHHEAILALSTAFWNAYLKNDQSAKAWLTSQDVRSVLAPADRWKHK